MAHRELELTLVSARDLKNVNLFTRMDVYAVASISGDPMTRQCTPTDTSGGRNPSWNATFRFSVPPSAAAAAVAGGGWLHVLLRSERALGDRDVGEVVIPLAELLAGADGNGPQPSRVASYQVHTVQRGEPRGVLNVSYRLGPVVAPVAERADERQPVYAYPAPQQQPFEPQNPYKFHPQNEYEAYAPPPQHFKPQNPALPPQQPYQYYYPQHEAYAPPPQQSFKSQNPAPPQQPSKPQNPAAPQQQPSKPQNPTPPHQQPSKPQNPAPPQQQLSKPQNPAAPPQQNFKPQNPAPPPRQPYPDQAYTPPQSPANGKSNGYGPTQVYMGPHTQIIFSTAAPTPPQYNNSSVPARTDDGPTRPKPSYTPTQPITSPTKSTNQSWPKAASPQQQHQDTPTWANASPKKPAADRSTQPQQHDTIKVVERATTQQPITSPLKTENSSWPKASPQHHDNHQTWSNNVSPRKPEQRPAHQPQQHHDTKVTELVRTQSKIGTAKTGPQEQKNTQASNIISAISRKTDDTRVGEYGRSYSNVQTQPGKAAADSTRPKEAYPNNNWSTSRPGKVDHQSGGHKQVMQHDRVISLPTATAR